MSKRSLVNLLIVAGIVVVVAVLVRYFGADLKDWFLAMHGRR